MSNLIAQTIEQVGSLEREAMVQAREKLDGLLKPIGSLGKLEELAVQMAGILGYPLPNLDSKAIIMMGADNGIYEEEFNSYPQEITKAVAELSGPGLIGVSVLARHAGCKVVVVDVGIKGDLKGNHIISRKIREGTDNIARGPAMTREEALQAVTVGIEVANSLFNEGVTVLGTGEVGICNTATSAAVLAALTGTDPEEVVGKGTGADEKAYQKKLAAVRSSLRVNKPFSSDSFDVLAKVGGLDIAGLVGCYLAAAAQRKPIVIDGFIAGTAALVAVKICPQVKDYMIPSHLSAEKGAKRVFQLLELEPMLLMDMRLGEGTGAALAFNLLDAAARIISEMGSFSDLG